MVTLRELQHRLFFLVGFALGFCFYILTFTEDKTMLKVGKTRTYNDFLSRDLFNEVTILCMIMTNPNNHRVRSDHVKNTWGKRCNKLMFISSKKDPEFETIIINVNESRSALRKKAKGAFLYAHDHFINDFDWFIKADDDSYVIMENLRYMLSQYRTETALHIGHRLLNPTGKPTENPEGYMAGGLYILSRKALEKFAVNVKKHPKKFFYPDGAGEDLNMGKALAHLAIFVDDHDENNSRRFFPVPIPPLRPGTPKWYPKVSYHNVSGKGLDTCSDVPVQFHYTKNNTMYKYEYLTYCFHPFGYEKVERRDLPRKLSLDEIIAASDAKSFAPRFIDHKDYHNLTSSEYF